MSMLSMQVDELRELAGDGGMEWVTGPIRASVLSDAADTIWSMRERLRAAYAETQELQRRVAELDELLPENGRWYSAEVTEAYVAENARLREYIEHKKDLQDFARLVNENSKLRELVRKVLQFERAGCEGCPYVSTCDVDCLYEPDCPMQEEIERDMRELGVEVDA